MKIKNVLEFAKLPAMTGEERQLFLGATRSGNFNSRLTSAGRMTHVDAVLKELCKSYHDPHAVLRVHDMACSDGLTSLDLYDHLKDDFDVVLEASDLHLSLRLLRTATGALVEYDQGEPIAAQIGAIPRVYFRKKNGEHGRRFSLVRGLVLAGGIFSRSVADITLLHPRAVAAANEERNISFHRRNILEPDTGKYHVIRIAGVFHSWNDALIAEAIRAVVPSLDENGILSVASGQWTDLKMWKRTFPCCSFFIRRDAKLVHLSDVDASLPFRDVVLGAGNEALG